IGDVGVELRHVTEKLVALDDVGVAIQDAESRKGPLADLKFLRHDTLPASAATGGRLTRSGRAVPESQKRQLIKIVAGMVTARSRRQERRASVCRPSANLRDASALAQVEAIQLHHLGPGLGERLGELT